MLQGDARLATAYAAAARAAEPEVERVIRDATKEAIRNTVRHDREQKRVSRKVDGAARRWAAGKKDTAATKLDVVKAVQALQALPPVQDPPGLIEARRSRILNELKDRGVEERFREVHLDRLNPALPPSYGTVAARLLELIWKPQLIAIGGPRGRGKTSIVCGLMRAFIEAERPHVWYTTARNYLHVVTNASWQERLEMRRRFEKAHLLIIDEYQREARASSAREEAELCDLVDYRYAAKRATILVTNLEREPFQEDVGNKVLRRLSEEGGFVPCRWERISEVLGRTVA